MSYEIHLSIPEDSQQGHLIASLSAEQQITPSRAVEHILGEAAQREVRPPNGPETPAQLVARLRAHKEARGAAIPRPPKTSLDLETFFGMLAGDQEFIQTMDEIIAGRAMRYGFRE